MCILNIVPGMEVGFLPTCILIENGKNPMQIIMNVQNVHLTPTELIMFPNVFAIKGIIIMEKNAQVKKIKYRIKVISYSSSYY